MRKGNRWDEPDDDWGARAVGNGTIKIANSSSSVNVNIDKARDRGGNARWILIGVLAIVVLYLLLAVFSRNMETDHIHEEHKYIPNSPHSMGNNNMIKVAKGGGSFREGGASSKIRKKQCKNEWTSDKLVGRCFGLSIHSKYSELIGNIEVVETADDCKQLCCELGDKCMTWQYWNENKRCNLGPAVRVGAEAMDGTMEGSTNWCEVEAPVVWRGRRIQNRDGPTCEWGDSLPTQCHGMGVEKRGDDGNRLARAVCERACCHIAGCTMWQQHPDRGCFIGSGDSIICESYTGSFTGGRKK